MSINKTAAGQGMEVANDIAKRNFTCKVVVAVDADVDIRNQEEVLQAIVARWQPSDNIMIYDSVPILPLDQSAPKIGRGSKIAIDATWQLPEEGRTRPQPEMNRSLLEQGAPEALSRADKKWAELIRNWQQPI